MEEKFFKEFNIQTITPVHIGCGTEEKLKIDIDYITDDNGKVKLVDWNKLLNDEKNRMSITLSLFEGEKNKIKNNIKNIAQNCKALIDTNIKINATEITRNLKNKLTNKPIIPGSSIKGAITSVLLEYFTQNKQNRQSLIKNPEKVLGTAKYGNHFMRFLQFTDIEFQDNTIVETKVFNLQNPKTGGWKHKKKTDSTFNDTSFVYAFEVIPEHSLSKIYIGFNEPAFKLAEKINLDEDKQIISAIKDKQNQIINNKISELFRIINEHTKNYIKKELKFYSSIKNKAQYQEELETTWENLSQIVEEAIKNGNKYCILRVGFGSGFHSITGDWWFETHEIDNIDFNRRNRGKLKGNDSSKSRKFIFEKINSDEYTFYPFGFVKIGDFKPEITSEDKEIKQININIKIQNENPPVSPVEEKKPYEPQYKSINKLKEGSEVEAVVTDFKNPMIYFKVFIEELKDYTYSLKYAAGLDVGTYCRVRITSINKKDPSKHTFSFIRKI